MATNKRKDYSLEETLKNLQTVIQAVASGNYQGTVFAAPQDVSTYDSVAATANGLVNGLLGKYMNQMMTRQVFQREHAVSAVLGTGAAGANLLGMLRRFNPGLADNILGMSGATEAYQSALLNANGIAAATGGRTGSSLDPHRMAANYRRAATQGALMLQNNLNKRGGLDTDFTYGLNMQQAAVIGNSILADSSHYDEWMKKQLDRTKKWKEAHKGEDEDSDEYRNKRREEKILTENDIKKFRNGTGLTSNAVITFNDHIKDFQKEMNGFVASVSKITGSFESAVDFIQDLTNGEAFSAGEKARRSRDHAARAAANLRVLAGDAGLPVGAMYNIVKGVGGEFDAARGKTFAEQLVGDRSIAANIGVMTAAAYASWQKAHPTATTEEQERAMYRFRSRALGFAKGDAEKDNVLLAQLVHMGRISEERAMSIAASGQQGMVGKVLRDEYGSNLELLRNNRIYMSYATDNNAPLVNKLNAISLNAGMSNEGIIRNQRGALDIGRQVASSMLSKALGRNVTSEIAGMQRTAMLDTETLRKAGLNDEQIALVQKKKGMNTSSLRRLLVDKMGADEMVLNREVSKSMVKSMRDKYGDKKGAKEVLDHFEEMVEEANPEVTEEQVKNVMANDLLAGKRNELNKTKVETLSAEGAGKKVMDDIKKAASGEGDLVLRDARFVSNYLEGELKRMGVNSITAKTALAGGLKAFHIAMDYGASMDVAMETAQEGVNKVLDAAKTGKRMVGLEQKKKRAKAGERYVKVRAASALFEKMLSISGMDDDQKEKARRQFMENLRGLKFMDVGRRRGESDASVAQRMRASIAETAIKAAQGDKKTTAALNPEDLDENTLRNAIKTDEAQRTVSSAIAEIYQSVDLDNKSVEDEVNKMYNGKTEAEREGYRKRVIAEKGKRRFLRAEARTDIEGDVNRYVAEGSNALSTEYTEALNRRLDSEDARGRGKSLGDFNDMEKALIAGKLHMDDKMKYLTEMFADPKGMVRGKDNQRENKPFVRIARENAIKSEATMKRVWGVIDANRIDEDSVAKLFKKLLNDPEASQMNAKDYREWLSNSRDLIATGLNFAVIGRKDADGREMDERSIMAAYVKAASAKEGDRKNALMDGYQTESMAQGGAAVSLEQLDYIRQIATAVTKMADNGSKD
jgi:hypothetical protein